MCFWRHNLQKSIIIQILDKKNNARYSCSQKRQILAEKISRLMIQVEKRQTAIFTHAILLGLISRNWRKERAFVTTKIEQKSNLKLANWRRREKAKRGRVDRRRDGRCSRIDGASRQSSGDLRFELDNFALRFFKFGAQRFAARAIDGGGARLGDAAAFASWRRRL